MDKIFKIYIYTNTINNKKYIGQTVRTLDERAGSNFSNYKESWRFFNAIMEDGPENFKREIIFETNDQKIANDKEIELISLYQTQDPNFGYNIQPGGSMFAMNEDIRKKIGEKVKSSKKFRENNFKSHAKRVIAIDISSGNYNIYDSITSAANILNESRGNIGCICNGTGRSLSLNGKLFRFENDFEPNKIQEYIDEYKKRKSKMYSVERNEKMANTIKEKFKNGELNRDYNKKKVRCLETGVVYNSIEDAGNATNTCYQNISQVCHGKRKTANKLHWEFYKFND